MGYEIGFVIVSHNQPRQLQRLVRRLQEIYNNPPIAVHHDFGQSPVRLDEFPSDIKFVTPHVNTRWAQFSVVTAALRALKLLYTSATPDWFFLLSGVDYPIAPATKVLNELATSGVDALMDYREVPDISDKQPLQDVENPALVHFTSNFRAEVAYRLYVGLNVWFPVVRKGPRIGRKTFYLRTRDWRAPFGPNFRCYYGDHWFAANSKAADVLLNPTEMHLRLQRHLQLRSSPDECYYHSVLANAPGLKICKATKRFAIWSGADHPKLLEFGRFACHYTIQRIFRAEIFA